MDSGFMFTYAGGSFITGQLGDRFSASSVIAIGLLGSTLCLLLILLGASTSIIDNLAISGSYFLTCQLLHGAFQATGGPVNTAIMGNWFPAKGRGLVFGLWTCHQYIGDIAAALFSAWILSSTYDWRWCIIVPAFINGVWGIFNFYFVPNTPEEAGILIESNKPSATKEPHHHSDDTPIGFFEAMMLPNVLTYSLAFGFFKLVNYAMFFQLPLILSSHFSPSTSNIISSLYSVGMMPGGIVCGWVSDLYNGRRACVIATFMMILCPLLLLFAYFMDDLNIFVLLILLAMMGCLVGGPNNIITSAVAADLADDPSITSLGGSCHKTRALGTVTGIINGSGSVTAAIGQMLIPVIASYGQKNGVGYRYVWLFLILCTLIGTSLMSGRIKKELQPQTDDGPSELPMTQRGTNNYNYSSIKQDDNDN